MKVLKWFGKAYLETLVFLLVLGVIGALFMFAGKFVLLVGSIALILFGVGALRN